MLTFLRPVWLYRGFILGNIRRDFQSRYRNSLLGAFWVILNPLAQITVYTVIFSKIMHAKLPGVESTYGYGMFLCAGILGWGLFSEIATRSQSMFLENANMLKKICFPRLCLPVIVIANGVLNFCIVFGLFTGFMIFSGLFPGLPYLALLPVVLLLVLFSAGLGLVLGVLNVFFRDVGQLFGILITFWFWLTPIVYPKNILPAYAEPIVAMNPMTGLISAIQGVVLQGAWPDWKTLLYPAVAGILLCMLGWHLFRRHSGDMVDEL